MFVATIPNVTVTAGRDAALPCIVKDIGDYKVTWMHLNRVMLLTIDETTITLIPRFRVTRDDPTTWTLHIRNVQPDDTGYYVCQVNIEPAINRVGYVQVVVPPQFVDAESSQSHVSVQESDDVRLVCRATGVPKPRIRWTREDGLPFTTSRGSQAVKFIDSGELMLKGVTRKDMGAYLCIATNKVPPSISKRIVLNVHFQPLITVPNQLVGAPVGTSVTLECQVAAFPNAVHFWRFNNQLLINSSRQETQELRTGYTTTMKLLLRNLRHKEDFGTYVCGAKNSLGETESNVRLYEIVVNRGADEKPEHSSIGNSVLRPEQRNEDRSLDVWHRPELDSASPGYTLEENAFIRGGVSGSLAGGGHLEDHGTGTNGRSSMGATASSGVITYGNIWAFWGSFILPLATTSGHLTRLCAFLGLLLLLYVGISLGIPSNIPGIEGYTVTQSKVFT
ncbi:lachesin-like isoform X2 [Cherax quadricarinatus]|uniref:lachesin-like isoform X2 n=1 Tax=Cherax quadricarinatus TaxID=27406 RepID=UPI00387EA1E4